MNELIRPNKVPWPPMIIKREKKNRYHIQLWWWCRFIAIYLQNIWDQWNRKSASMCDGTNVEMWFGFVFCAIRKRLCPTARLFCTYNIAIPPAPSASSPLMNLEWERKENSLCFCDNNRLHKPKYAYIESAYSQHATALKQVTWPNMPHCRKKKSQKQ